MMRSKIRVRKTMILLYILISLSDIALAEGRKENVLPDKNTDSISLSRRHIHRLSLEARPGYIIPTNSFLRGNNEREKAIRHSFSTQLKYSFQASPNSYTDRIYGGAYQGFGLAYYTFGNRQELGDPIALYILQGGRIGRITPRLSLNYEWNFGVSFGWKPYDEVYNFYNKVIGSDINAYINTNFYFNWAVSRQFDLTSGITLTHFSNGNTKFPNAGLNAVGLKVGLIYHFNRTNPLWTRPSYLSPIPEFPRHISYDLVVFGSWRRKGVYFGESQVPSPDAYSVFGFNFTPMYNLDYKLRVGVSLDGVYDGSANVYTEDYISGTPQQFYKPGLDKQLALGLSGRVEYVMPYFTVGLGLGANVLHGGGDLKAFYQILALKIEMSRNSFLHIGYSLHNFHTPNYLMLGIGFRFHNKYPTFLR